MSRLPPPLRDTTPNSLRDIVHRLASIALLGSAALTPPFAASGWMKDRPDHLLVAGLLAGLTLVLVLTRRFWRTTAVPANPEPMPAVSSTAPEASTALAHVEAASSVRPRLLLLNGSLAGSTGNSAAALRLLAAHLHPHAEVLNVVLAGPDAHTFATLQNALRRADGFVFATGTHWDSWSSALQRFLEDATPAEGTALWLGKPAAVVVTEHSTGGKGVLSRLQGVLVTLGCSLPPMSGLVLSKATRLAATHAPPDIAGREDFWTEDDLAVVAHNLLEAARGGRRWRSWPVDRTEVSARWLT